METYNDKMSSIYNLTLEHYQELENNIGYCDNIADIKSKIKDEGVTDINILNELNVDEPDTSLVFASILKSKKNINSILLFCCYHWLFYLETKAHLT